MQITVYGPLRPKRYRTEFNCCDCVHYAVCRQTGYKKDCVLCDFLGHYFCTCYQMPYFLTRCPRAILMRLGLDESMDQARAIIKQAKQQFMVQQK